MKKFKLISDILLIVCFGYVSSQTYSIVAPKIIRPKADFNIITALDGYNNDIWIRFKIEKTLSNSKESNQKDILFKESHNFQMINLEIGFDWTPGEYELSIESLNTTEIPKKKLPVHFAFKQFVILVQTDKKIYKPGQDVLLRTIIMDYQLKPVNIDEINDLKIFLMDPQGVKLREFILRNSNKGEQDSNGINLFDYAKGVTEDIAFKIPDPAETGEWKISVLTKGQVQNYTFFVDYYTLPLANVTIVVPNFINYKDPVLNYQVKAFYTFGQPVNGKLDVTIEKIRECGTPLNIKGVKDSFQISGNFEKKIDLNDLEIFSSKCNEMTFNISAEVYDSKTNSIYFNYETFDVIKQDIKAFLEDRRDKYRPGKRVIQAIKLNSNSGKVIKEEDLKSFTCEAEFKSNTSPEYKNLTVTNVEKEDGRIICEFKTQPGYTSLKLKLINSLLKEESPILQSIYNFEKGCVNDTVEIYLQNRRAKIYSENITTLIVESTQNIESLFLFVVVRGSIINATPVQFQFPAKEQKIELKLTKDMVPEALISVSMKVPKSNLILSDSLLLKVNGIFHNEVNFEVLTPSLDAGEEAKIIVSAESESKVYLLAIDEAVLALEDEHNINYKRIMQESANEYEVPIDDFLHAGMNFTTNGENECSNNFYSTEYFGTFPVDEDKFDKSKIRKNFKETWIWDRIEIPHQKSRIGFSSKVPDSITSWKITGFAMHEEKGFGLTNNHGHIRVFRPFFLKLNLPYSIQREEVTEIHILVFNYLNETLHTILSVSMNDSKSEVDFIECDQKFNLIPYEIKTITCLVKSSNVGKFDIIANAKAVSQSKLEYEDAEEKQLLVIFEGLIQRKTKTIYFDLTSEDKDNHVEKLITIDFPKERIIGSENLLFSATTELITVEWQERLKSIQEKYFKIHYDFTSPLACCQQRVVLYFPKVYWLDYIITTKRATDENISMAKKVVQTTFDYLCHQNPYDGSYVYYETWGSAGTIISKVVDAGTAKSFLWLTAYTLKLMTHAKRFVMVTENSITDAKNWINKQLSPEGTYIETDPEHSLYSTQTNAYLTAFVRIAMFESGQYANKTTDKWMSDIFPNLTDPLDIMSICYALNLVKSDRAIECYKVIENKMLVDNSTGNYWIGKGGQPDLHLTAYGLLILTERKSNALALNVFKYIASRQDSQGNFHPAIGGSEFDSYITIICTEAMNKFIQLTNRYEPGIENVFVHFNTDEKDSVIHLRPKSDIVEVIEANPNSSRVKIFATGYGRAKANIYLQYNVLNLDEGYFSIKLTPRPHNKDYFELDICTNYKKGSQISNGIVEIDLPSGYKYHEENMILDTALIDKIESKNLDSHIIVYLKKINQTEICFTIPVVQCYNVKNRFPGNVKVYPYYDKSALSVQTFEIK